jgi:hypothetical protein
MFTQKVLIFLRKFIHGKTSKILVCYIGCVGRRRNAREKELIQAAAMVAAMEMAARTTMEMRPWYGGLGRRAPGAAREDIKEPRGAGAWGRRGLGRRVASSGVAHVGARRRDTTPSN